MLKYALKLLVCIISRNIYSLIVIPYHHFFVILSPFTLHVPIKFGRRKKFIVLKVLFNFTLCMHLFILNLLTFNPLS